MEELQSTRVVENRHFRYGGQIGEGGARAAHVEGEVY
jgi:hypothetical protein